MENQPKLVMAGDGDHVKEVNVTGDNVVLQDNSHAKKEAIEKQLRQKINMYLENKNNVANAEIKKGETNNTVSVEEVPRTNLPKKPCNHFNDFGTCKYDSGHFSKSGDISLIHVCRYCHDSSGKKELHPATLCAQLKTKGVLQDLGVPLKIPDLNKDIMEEGTETELGEEIAANLYEPKVDMIVGVVKVIGRDAAAENFKKTQDVEFSGGMMIFNGTRRRTAGGTFLQLLRENHSLDQEKIAIFLDNFNGVQAAKMKRKEEMYSSQGRSFHLNKSSSVKSFLPKSDNDRLNFTRNSRNLGDASPEKLTGMKEPHVLAKLSINDRMNEIISRNIYIPKPRTGPVVSRPSDITSKSTPRSRLFQSEQGNYGMSTPKSRLSSSMDNYMVSAGPRRNEVKKNEGRNQRTAESRPRFLGSRANTAMWKDSRQDSRKASIEQIIGCLNQQRTDPIRTTLSQRKGVTTIGNGINEVIHTKQSFKHKEEIHSDRMSTTVGGNYEAIHTKQSFKRTEEIHSDRMSTNFRNEPWLAAYQVAKQKAVHNLENGNLQSVGGISGYCGQVTSAGHVATSSTQIDKLMSKMKMEGRQETVDKYGGRFIRRGTIESKCEMTKTPLNPKAVPFNPSMGLFNPATPPSGVNVPYGFPHLSKGPAEVLKKERKCHESEDSKVIDDIKRKGKGENLDVTKNRNQNNLSNGAKFCSSLEAAKKRSDFSTKKNNHCPCPPYCPSCLEKIKAQA